MKLILLLVTILFIHASSYSQSKNDDYKKMIDSAITIQHMTPDKVPCRAKIYLLDAKDQAYVFTSETDQKKFSYINLYDKKNRGKLKKGIHAWKIFPVLSANKLIVDIVDFTITYKNKIYNFGNRGGGTVIFEYSCNESKWMFRETSWSGI